MVDRHDDLSTASHSPAPQPAHWPDRIGPYRILEVLGDGGMGTVYLAEQSEPVRRRVALKLIKLGMDSKQVIARFEAERQALAMMNHANVAKVFDAGLTGDGRPFFVMELVKGEPITSHCDRQRLTISERLELFMPVCEAVQHAHQKGIIHRDIKPSNILVEYADGKPVPKVIDFGVAKATSQRLTEKTVFTEQGQLIGTPDYMSPEQAEMTSQDIDTRTDIYSLGVLLYELLTGTLPFDPKSLRSEGFAAIQRIIREVEPPKPSTRWSRLSADDRVAVPRAPAWVADIARHRGSDPKTLLKHLRGDLDWIVMKCLEKDRGRRYDTANALAMEIRRHLNNEPVLAGRPSAAYRLAKFVRRNRAGVAAAGVIAAVLIAATAVSIGFALSEAEQRRVAQAAEAQQSRARQEAERQTRIAKSVSDFLTKDLLATVAPSPDSGRGKDVLMRDVLDAAAERIKQASRAGGRFEEMPLVETSIRAALGLTYRLLGEYAAAEPHLERARLLRRRELGEEHPSTLDAINDLAVLYWDQGRYDEAEPLLVETLDIRRRVLGEEHPRTLASMNNLANLYKDQGRYGETEPLYVRALEIRNRVLGRKHRDTLASMNNLAILYKQQGRYDKAESLYVRALKIQKRVPGEEHPRTATTMNNLAILYVDQGRYDEAQPLHVRALEIRKRVLGEEHRETLASMNNLAILYKKQSRYGEAESLYVKALEIQKRVLGREHPSTLDFMHNLAMLYVTQGRYDEAQPLYVRALEIKKRVLGREHPRTLVSQGSLAVLYYRQGRYDQAEPLFVQALEIQKRVLGQEHPDTLRSMNNLANLYAKQGRMDDARPLVRAQQEAGRRRAARSAASANDKNELAWNLLTCRPADLRDPEAALHLARDACAMTNNANPAFLDTLALAQHLTGHTPAAIETQKKALSLLPPDTPGRGDYQAALARFEAALKEAHAAEEPGGG